MNTTDTFLTDEELVRLTARKVKNKQIESLRRMGIPFFINACGRPIVARTAINGLGDKSVHHPAWMPRSVVV